MKILEAMGEMGHEQVVFCRDEAAGYRAIIAIHSTVLGPAVGGTRMWRYASEAEALEDALRLSRGMTYKNALAGLAFGGGKSVILRGESVDREAVFRAHGRAVAGLGGRYFTAEDVGTSVADMDIVRRETEFVGGTSDGIGDPSPFTARGVLRAIEAAATKLWGSRDLEGRTVALQGCGNVGAALASDLAARGVRLVVTDIDSARAERVAASVQGRAVPTGEIYDVAADVFAPCALGGILNDETIPRLRAAIVAGAANNQLRSDRSGDALAARGILYAPDYAANAGGVISGHVGLTGGTAEQAFDEVDRVYETVLKIFERAETDGIPPHRAADALAEEVVARARSARSR